MSEVASGPAYGVRLDDLLPGWRRQLRLRAKVGLQVVLRYAALRARRVDDSFGS